MKSLTQLWRLIHINFILMKHGLDKIVLSIPIFAPISFLAYLNPWHYFTPKDKKRGERLREALIELGPIFVKFGQMLSTRSDLLPEDIVEELSKLQDNVPPFPTYQAKKIIEEVYGETVEQLFLEFQDVPLASASIAQVHALVLHSQQNAVLKIVRPGIEKKIRRDVALLYTLSRLAERYWVHGKRLHLIELVEEFEYTILNELDLLREAANAAQLRRNFLNSPLLYVPEIYWPYARENIIVMERVYGIPISDLKTLREHNVNLKVLAERGVEIFFTQVFLHSFFHADMHPGNIMVDATYPENPRYIAVDFGIMGSLSKEDQYFLAANFFAFFNRDYHRVATLHIESGWISANVRVAEFESAIRAVCEPIFEKPLKDISFSRILMRLFQTGRRFEMEVQPQLFLLQKTLFSVEGLGRKLYPDLDLWSTAKPFLREWLKKNSSPRILFDKVCEKLPAWMHSVPEVPLMAYDTLISLKKYLQKHNESKETREEEVYLARKESKVSAFVIGVLVTVVVVLVLKVVHLI